MIKIYRNFTLLFLLSLTLLNCDLFGDNKASHTGQYAFKQVIVDNNEVGHVHAMGDVNGDGKTDIVGIYNYDKLVCYRYPDWKKLILRDYSEFSDYTYTRSDDMKLADIDNDGDLDVVTRIGIPKNDRNGVTVWFENPRPNHPITHSWLRHDIGQNKYVKDISVIDFNRDGKLDVVTRENARVQIWFQLTPYSWEKKQFTIHNHEGMDVGDLDGDGDPDIVLNGFWFETPEDPQKGIYIEHNIDSKWWTNQSGEQMWQHYNCKVGIADVNSDGKKDVILSHSEMAGFPVSWYSAKDPKNGPWIEHVIAERVDYCHNLQAADFNNDGKMDILAGGMPKSKHKRLTIYFGDGSGDCWTRFFVQAKGSYSAELADIENDGDIDIVTVRNWDRGPLEVWQNELPQSLREKKQTAKHLAIEKWTYIQVDNRRDKWGKWDDPRWAKYFGLGIGDITGDGLKDIVSGRYFYRNPGKDMSGPWPRVDFGVNCDASLILDVDADEFGDVIAPAGDKIFWLEAKNWRGTSWKATVIDWKFPKPVHGNPQGYAAAQIVPGGKFEIVLASGDGSYYYYQIPDKPDTKTWTRKKITDHSNGEGVGIGDIDGDGLMDISVARSEDWKKNVKREIKWCRNPGNGSENWQSFIIGSIDGRWPDRVAVADLNGDNRPDIIVSEESQQLEPNWKTYWFEAPIDPRQGEWKRHVLVTQYTTNSMDIADIDKDGDIDVILAEHRGSKKLSIWENDGEGNFKEHIIDKGKENHLGARLADLDWDGDKDIVGICWDDYQLLHLWRNDNYKIEYKMESK